MITLPEGFDVAALILEFFAFAEPFVGVAFIFGVGFMILRLLGVYK